MYYAEHRFLGDTTALPTDSNVPSLPTSDTATVLELENKLLVTYGEINGFGDYFGFAEPISCASSAEEMKALFHSWFDLLGTAAGGKLKAEALRTELKAVNDQVVHVLTSATGGTGDELAKVYKDTPLNVSRMEAISKDVRWAKGAAFMKLLATNADHFGEEARRVYEAGHTLAIDFAVKGELSKALAINGFADHFLQDSFAAGHLRVPRLEIMKLSNNAVMGLEFLVNATANVMHEEDGILGVWVESPTGETWKAFGDGRLPGKDTTGKATSTTIAQCRKAMQQSVQEIKDAYTSRQAPKSGLSSAWQHAPILEKISSNPDNHHPLIKIEAGKIYTRLNGLKSEQYEEIVEAKQWMMFYMNNWTYVEDQVRTFVGEKLGSLFSLSSFFK